MCVQQGGPIGDHGKVYRDNDVWFHGKPEVHEARLGRILSKDSLTLHARHRDTFSYLQSINRPGFTVQGYMDSIPNFLHDRTPLFIDPNAYPHPPSTNYVAPERHPRYPSLRVCNSWSRTSKLVIGVWVLQWRPE